MLLSSYYFLLLLLPALVTQNLLTLLGAYIILGFFLTFALIRYQCWKAIFPPCKDKFELLLTLFIWYSGFSGLWGHDPRLSLIHAAALYAVFLFIRTGTLSESHSHGNTSPSVETLRFIIPSALFVLATLYALSFHPTQVLQTQPIRLIGIGHEKNHTGATLQSCLIVFTLALFLSRKHLTKIIAFLFCIISTVLIVFTYSRATIFSVFFMIMSTMLLLFITNNKEERKDKLTLLAILLFIIISSFFIYLVLLKFNLHRYFASTINHKDGRLVIWHYAVSHSLHANWLTGIGIGNEDYILKSSGLPRLSTPHNSIISIFNSTGAIGLSLFLSMLVFYFKNLYHHFDYNKNLIGAYIGIASLSLLIHSMLESYLLAQLLPFYFLFIYLYYLSEKLAGIKSNK